MKKKAKRKRTSEERRRDRERGERVERLLKERIAYHERKLREEGREPKTLEELLAERRAKLREEGRDLPTLEERIAFYDAKLREENPGWTPPQTSEEWQAYYEAKWAAERAEGEDAG